MKRRIASVVVGMCLVSALFTASTTARAATRTWTGNGGNDKWTTAANWDALPADGDLLVFPDNANQRNNTNDFTAGTTFHTITFSKVGGGGTQYNIYGNAFNIGMGGFVENDDVAAASKAFTAPVTLTQNTSFNVAQNAYLTFYGAISGPYTVYKGGPGFLGLNGANTYTGLTTLAQGTIEVRLAGVVAGAVQVNANTRFRLFGGGTALGQITVTGGILDVVGNGKASGGVVFQGASTFDWELDNLGPGNFSHLVVTGAVDLGSTTTLASGGSPYTPVVGDTFVLVDNDGVDPIIGTFQNMPEGATVLWSKKPMRISYVGGDGNDITLTAVIPTTVTLASSKNPQILATPVTITATVTGTGTHNGLVDFYDGFSKIGSSAVNAATNTATITTSALTFGDHTIKAMYAGDSDDADSFATITQSIVSSFPVDAGVNDAGDDGGVDAGPTIDAGKPGSDSGSADAGDLGGDLGDTSTSGCDLGGPLSGSGAGPAIVLFGIGLVAARRRRS